MTSSARAVGIAVAIGCLLFAHRRAGAQDSVRKGADSLRVDSARADSVRSLLPVTVTATRLSGAGQSTEAHVDVLRPNTLAPSPSALADAMAASPGVNVTNDQGTRAQPTIEMRGFTLSPVAGVPQGISVFLDGVRINEPDAQELNFDLVPTDAIDRADLIRGPSALFGKNTLAGALNLYTVRGDATPHVTLETAAGSFGYRESHLLASGERDGIDGTLLVKASR